MDDYVPGLISDIISGKPNSKSKPKKKLKLQKKISEDNTSKNTNNAVSQLKKKKKIEASNSSDESLVKKKKLKAQESISNEKLSPSPKKFKKFESSLSNKKEKKKKIVTTNSNDETAVKKKKLKAQESIPNEKLSPSPKKLKKFESNLSDKKNKIETTNPTNESSVKKKKVKAREPTPNEKLSPRPKKLKKSELNVSNKKETDKKIDIDDLRLSDNPPSDSDGEVEEKVMEKPKTDAKRKPNTGFDARENTIFIGNIPVTYDKHKICKIFSKYGDIQSARIRCIPVADINMSKKVAAIKKKFNPNRQSAVAYVKYKSLDSAKAALQGNGMVIDGHHLRVDLAEENKERSNNKAVFVGGLPFDIEDDELWEFFEKCGKINSVRIIRDSQTSMGKGFGYVNFDSTSSVELALQLDGHELKKRAINVKRCMPPKNKNKVKTFGKKKSNEITTALLCKRGKKFKEERKKKKKEKTEKGEFQGRTANMKQKKKKKLSESARKQKKLVKVLGAA